jgi:hypothetical protein
MEKGELIIMALQQRIGELELEKAIIRAEFTEQSNNIESLKKEIDEYSKIIKEKAYCEEI